VTLTNDGRSAVNLISKLIASSKQHQDDIQWHHARAACETINVLHSLSLIGVFATLVNNSNRVIASGCISSASEAGGKRLVTLRNHLTSDCTFEVTHETSVTWLDSGSIIIIHPIE